MATQYSPLPTILSPQNSLSQEQNDDIDEQKEALKDERLNSRMRSRDFQQENFDLLMKQIFYHTIFHMTESIQLIYAKFSSFIFCFGVT